MWDLRYPGFWGDVESGIWEIPDFGGWILGLCLGLAGLDSGSQVFGIEDCGFWGFDCQA